MSFLPYIVRDMVRPIRMMEQHMRMAQEMIPTYFFRNQPFKVPYIEFSEDTTESVVQHEDKFQIKLNIASFTPQEITVKTVGGNLLVIEGKHEEKQDDKGFISRQFVRKFVLPKDHELKSIVSSLSSSGILTITAPRKPEAIEPERVIPITHEETEKSEQKE